VSENEIRNIHAEMASLRINEKALRRKLFASFDNSESLSLSNQSQNSDVSFRNTKTRLVETPLKPKRSSKTNNFGGINGESNSACSKTTSNTKASPNMVRISMKPKKLNMNVQSHVENHLGKIPSIVSIDPGKTIILRFEAPKIVVNEPKLDVKCKKNIFKEEILPEQNMQNLNSIKGVKLEKDIKESMDAPNKPHSIYNMDMFPSIGDYPPQESLNLRWDMDSMNQEVPQASNYLKPEVHEKFINLEQSNISQIMESVEGCGDFYLNKPLLSISNEQMKSYQMGGTSILNQFGNNITPIFSINEDMGGDLRGHILESENSQEDLAPTPRNIPPFVITQGEDMMSEEF